ncbi:hypothetical protein CEY16_00350 [Halalkalibacillus sediminis]|uniref:ABC transporter domain-containing protein n=1 Tax=Halalkalibacillus sediminis TaxID=2018042 RepID=A0A2I0QVA4_9BACI|nr:ABC transporter ATP-binding protein [Halalkalibacillus sediminis]PKR78244.1 hypothetical protein CEY16_00350 [Halalkalibacillus sediminis]
MIELNGISYRQRNNIILNAVSSSIHNGDCIAIFGPNGAGKSTLIQILAGLLKSSSGEIKYDFERSNQVIGYVPQKNALFENLTVKDHLNFFSKMVKDSDPNFVDGMYDALDLKSLFNQKVSKLSGGQMKKLNLAVGMIQKPDIVFLDEAFVGVDLAAKYDMLDWLKKMNTEGMTIVFITHDWDTIKFLSRKMWVVDEGKLTAELSPEQFKSMPTQITEGSRALQKMFKMQGSG